MWCGDGLFSGAQKHATEFNFIFSVGRGCEAALAKELGRFAKPAAEKVWVEPKSRPQRLKPDCSDALRHG
jgi:hypothetical protein